MRTIFKAKYIHLKTFPSLRLIQYLFVRIIGSRLDLNTMKMKENQTYAIFLFLKKDARTSVAFQVLELVEGDPPELGIE